MENFPCDGCELAEPGSSCVRACARLHKFLREDLKCHTRVRTTELVLPDETLQHISDYQQVNQTRLTMQDLAEAAPDYWSIELTENITEGEKVILSAFYVEGLSYKEIAHRYKISVPKVKFMLMQTKKHLRKVRNTSVLIPISEE